MSERIEETKKEMKEGGKVFTLRRELNLERRERKDREREGVKSRQLLLPLTLLGTQ